MVPSRHATKVVVDVGQHHGRLEEHPPVAKVRTPRGEHLEHLAVVCVKAPGQGVMPRTWSCTSRAGLLQSILPSLFSQRRRERCLALVLRLRGELAVHRARNVFADHLGRELRHALGELPARLIIAYRDAAHSIDGAGVEPFVHLHQADAGRGLAAARCTS